MLWNEFTVCAYVFFFIQASTGVKTCPFAWLILLFAFIFIEYTSVLFINIIREYWNLFGDWQCDCDFDHANYSI